MDRGRRGEGSRGQPTDLGECGVEDDVGAVLEQRHGGAAHASAGGERGLDGARARGARHAGDAHLHPPHAGLRLVLPLRPHPGLLVVGAQQRDLLHLVVGAAGERRELEVGHGRRRRGGGGKCSGGERKSWGRGGGGRAMMGGDDLPRGLFLILA